MKPLSAPTTESELLERAAQIAGMTLLELALQQQQTIPDNLLHAKGWIGQLIEQALGASAGSRAEQDFPQLGIELKTIPLTAAGYPKETTYVCTVPLNEPEPNWESSWIRKKLSYVLWLPIEADPALAIAERHIGSAVLTELTSRQDQQLKQDWQQHMELISTGRIDEISAHDGTYLQVRPKAANRTALRTTTDANGDLCQTLPRGFYLRTVFTADILAQNYI